MVDINFLKKISTNDITLLKDINCALIFDKHRYKFFLIPNFEPQLIRYFISKLNKDYLYSVIPFISKDSRVDDPYLVISRQFLVTKYSNDFIITKYLTNNLDIAMNQFNIDKLEDHCLVFRYKKLSIDYNKI